MRQKKIFLLFAILFISATTFAQGEKALFDSINRVIESDNYFEGRELFEARKDDLSEGERCYISAVLDNAFNRTGKSEEMIESLFRENISLHDSLKYNLISIKKDNLVKLFRYKEAAETIEIILKDYPDFITDEEKKDYENELILWGGLAEVEPQRTVIKGKTSLKLERDSGGFDNIPVTANGNSLGFIFDTGANISTVSEATAKKLGIRILQKRVRVGTSTGKEIISRLGVCEKISFGAIDLYNTVFLVVSDDILSFPQANYVIHGILGFPVMNSLKEIRISRDGNFVVPKEESKGEESSELAMHNLTPLINIEGRHYTFDTGADKTTLYNPFYLLNRERIDKDYKEEKFKFAGAGGYMEFTGFIIDHDFRIAGKIVSMKGIQLLKNKIDDGEKVYGNIGQDFIRQFETMIINFDKMFVRFE